MRSLFAHNLFPSISCGRRQCYSLGLIPYFPLMSGPHKYRHDALMPKDLHLANRYLTEASRAISPAVIGELAPAEARFSQVPREGPICTQNRNAFLFGLVPAPHICNPFRANCRVREFADGRKREDGCCSFVRPELPLLAPGSLQEK